MDIVFIWDYMCNGANEMWGVRIHVQVFIYKHSQYTGRVKQRQTDMARARHKSDPRASVGRRSANNIQQGKAER